LYRLLEILFVVGGSKYCSFSFGTHWDSGFTVAKVMRDRISSGWKFSEPGLQDVCGKQDFGSGYPSDPKCKAWLKDTLKDKVFGYSDFVRFSWAPIKSKLRGEDDYGDSTTTMVKAAPVVFAADLDEEEMEQRQSQKGMSTFLIGVSSSSSSKAKQNCKKRKRSTFYRNRKLQVVSSI